MRDDAEHPYFSRVKSRINDSVESHDAGEGSSQPDRRGSASPDEHPDSEEPLRHATQHSTLTVSGNTRPRPIDVSHGGQRRRKANFRHFNKSRRREKLIASRDQDAPPAREQSPLPVPDPPSPIWLDWGERVLVYSQNLLTPSQQKSQQQKKLLNASAPHSNVAGVRQDFLIQPPEGPAARVSEYASFQPLSQQSGQSPANASTTNTGFPVLSIGFGHGNVKDAPKVASSAPQGIARGRAGDVLTKDRISKQRERTTARGRSRSPVDGERQNQSRNPLRDRTDSRRTTKGTALVRRETVESDISDGTLFEGPENPRTKRMRLASPQKNHPVSVFESVDILQDDHAAQKMYQDAAKVLEKKTEIEPGNDQHAKNSTSTTSQQSPLIDENTLAEKDDTAAEYLAESDYIEPEAHFDTTPENSNSSSSTIGPCIFCKEKKPGMIMLVCDCIFCGPCLAQAFKAMLPGSDPTRDAEVVTPTSDPPTCDCGYGMPISPEIYDVLSRTLFPTVDRSQDGLTRIKMLMSQYKKIAHERTVDGIGNGKHICVQASHNKRDQALSGMKKAPQKQKQVPSNELATDPADPRDCEHNQWKHTARGTTLRREKNAKERCRYCLEEYLWFWECVACGVDGVCSQCLQKIQGVDEDEEEHQQDE